MRTRLPCCAMKRIKQRPERKRNTGRHIPERTHHVGVLKKKSIKLSRYRVSSSSFGQCAVESIERQVERRTHTERQMCKGIRSEYRFSIRNNYNLRFSFLYTRNWNGPHRTRTRTTNVRDARCVRVYFISTIKPYGRLDDCFNTRRT